LLAPTPLGDHGCEIGIDRRHPQELAEGEAEESNAKTVD
jgi:hypothetical protein